MEALKWRVRTSGRKKWRGSNEGRTEVNLVDDINLLELVQLFQEVMSTSDRCNTERLMLD